MHARRVRTYLSWLDLTKDKHTPKLHYAKYQKNDWIWSKKTKYFDNIVPFFFLKHALAQLGDVQARKCRLHESYQNPTKAPTAHMAIFPVWIRYTNYLNACQLCTASCTAPYMSLQFFFFFAHLEDKMLIAVWHWCAQCNLRGFVKPFKESL